ncbi:MAG: enoyl-CoA hydratase/isomerase family protein, partial [Xanthomonadales bacterium]|nr:enoyl-CoA hydratase/isomerase family protein [Xanthomonadales bacterium]
GIYRKQGKTIEVLDPATGEYGPSGTKPDPEVVEILKMRDPAARFAALREHASPQARFLWCCFRDLFHYCAVHLEDIAESARDVDLAMRWGYGYQQGPFETWQAAGWKQIAIWLREEIEAGETMADAPLPGWVDQLSDGPHGPEGSYGPAEGAFIPRSSLPVYERQPFPELLLGEKADPGHTLHEDDAVRIWHQDDGIAVLSFKSKMHTVSPAVVAGMEQALDIAEDGFRGLVIWQPREPFSVGADLSAARAELERAGPDAVQAVIETFQAANVRLRHSHVPTVAAVRGMALGGGCEILLHCDRTVAALESYIGLVEVGVGLLPAGGGLAELAIRAAEEAGPGDLFTHLRPYFERAAMGQVSASAIEAKRWGLLHPEDVVVMHAHELLHVARTQAMALAETAYRPPLPTPVKVAGAMGIANFKAALVNMLEGRFISEHDYEIGSRIATVLCGGEIEAGEVDRQWLLDLERDHFLALMQTEKTQERIQHMLKTGKPLRN